MDQLHTSDHSVSALFNALASSLTFLVEYRQIRVQSYQGIDTNGKPPTNKIRHQRIFQSEEVRVLCLIHIMLCRIVNLAELPQVRPYCLTDSGSGDGFCQQRPKWQ